MFTNYITVAFRNIMRHKLYSLINIGGLAVALACSALIFLFVADEMSFDKSWKDADGIYRLHTTFKTPAGNVNRSVQAQGPVKEALKRYFPNDIAYSARFTEMAGFVQAGNKTVNETITLTDPEMANIFSLNVISGNLEASLNDKMSVAISEKFARKYFNTIEAVDRILTITIRDLKKDYRVGAVFKDLPQNTVLSFQILTMLDEKAFPSRFDAWTSFSGQLYFKLKKDAFIENVKAGLEGFVLKNALLPDYTAGGGAVTDYLEYNPMALPDLQLYAEGWGEMKETGDIGVVIVFSIIAGLILIIACINFMNLMTAQSMLRAKEIAIRKTLGAKRYQVIIQFLAESILASFIALLFSMVIIEILLPYYNAFLGKNINANFMNIDIFLPLFTLAMGVGVLSGFYPAFKLSRMQPSKVLKSGKSETFSSKSKFHNGLVILQFAVSITLMTASVVIYKQMSHMSDLDLGYNKNNLLIVTGNRAKEARNNQKALKKNLLNLPNVTHVSYSWGVPGIGGNGSIMAEVPNQISQNKTRLRVLARDHHFLETYEIKLLAGRAFDPNLETDGMPQSRNVKSGEVLQGTIIVNEAAVKSFGFGTAEKAIGQFIRYVVKSTPEGPVFGNLKVIGVIPDIHLRSLHGEILPEIHDVITKSGPFLTIRYKGPAANIIQQVEKTWQDVNPATSFNYEFAGDALDISLMQDNKIGILLTVFALLAVMIACLGLLGLSSFMAQRRTKEIGIRKVFGAKIIDVIKLMVWQFSKPVLLANLIAWPAAYIIMKDYLDGFYYRVELSVHFFLIASIIALLIAISTVAGHAFKVASFKPINALRYE